jgi:chaperone modulatory protein CbpM
VKIEITEAVWIEECSLGELAERSCLPEELLRELIDCGVLQPCDHAADPLRFDGAALAAARAAARLRADFDLDSAGISMAVALLRRIGALEAEVQRLRALTRS